MKYTLAIFVLFFLSEYSYSQISQWRGPDRDGQFPDTSLLKIWPDEGPELIFSAEKIGKGYSSPVLANGKVFISGMIDTLDYISAFDLTGNMLWQVPCGRSWKNSFPDTRSTPLIENDKVYFQTGTGRLICLSEETGAEIWAVEVDEQYETEYHLWGNSETPLLLENMIICSPGGKMTSIVAFNKNTGEKIWQSESLGGPRAYASATVAEFNGHRFILAVIGTHLIALKSETGEIAWSYRYHDPEAWDQSGLIWANTPLVEGNQIFLNQGYNYKAVMLEMDDLGTGVSEKFVDQTFDNHHHGMVYHDGYVYGSNWYSNRQGKWVCMNWETGEIRYVADWETKGTIVMADDLLYCYNEKGTVGLVKPDPDGFEVISEFKIKQGGGPHWAHPFIGDGKLLLRHGDALMVYDISKK